jgi:hypothetical protein
MTAKKHAHEREMTRGEKAADQAHRDAHARAVAEEAERNEIIKERIASGDIEPGVPPDQLEVTPQATPTRRAADVYLTRAEDHGGARGPAPAAPVAATEPAKGHARKE